MSAVASVWPSMILFGWRTVNLFPWHTAWEGEDEPSLSVRPLVGQRSPVALGDPFRRSEPKPRAFADLFGGEEGLHDARRDVGWDTGTGVGDGDANGAVVAAGADADPPHRFVLDGIVGVAEQVDQYLGDLGPTTVHQEIRRD